MAVKKVRCFAHGASGDWEGVCIDFDIAVQGSSFDEVRNLLDEAVHSYVEDACAEDRETARRLLNRRAPLGVRVKYAAGFLATSAFNRNTDECRAGFDLACPA